MKYTYLFLIFFTVFEVYSTASFKEIFRDKKYPGKCTITDKLILSPGKTAAHPLHSCSYVKCQKDSVATVKFCPIWKPKPNCTEGDYINKNAKFPICCLKRHVC